MCQCKFAVKVESLVPPPVLDRDSSLGIGTHCGLDGQGIKLWWGWDFSHASRPSLGPTHPPI